MKDELVDGILHGFVGSECQSPRVVPYISYLKEGHSLVCS